MLAFSLVVLVLLILIKLAPVLKGKFSRRLRWFPDKIVGKKAGNLSLFHRFQNHMHMHYPTLIEHCHSYLNLLSATLHRRTHTLTSRHLLLRILQLFAYTVIIVFYLYYFGTFLTDLSFFASSRVYNTTWNFGQVVALSVWLPPICEYVYLELRGVRKGFEYRLRPKDYRVIRIDMDRDIENGEKPDIPIAGGSGRAKSETTTHSAVEKGSNRAVPEAEREVNELRLQPGKEVTDKSSGCLQATNNGNHIG